MAKVMQKMDKMVGREELEYVGCRGVFVGKGRVKCGVMPMEREKC